MDPISKKKICFVVATPLTARAFLMNHIEALSEYYDISIIANFGKESADVLQEGPFESIIDVKISRNINLIQDLKALLQLKREFQKHKFDAVHSVTPKAGLLAMIAARLAGVAHRIHIFTGQVWHTKKGFFKWMLKFLDRRIVRNATCILVDGKSQREYLISNQIVSSEDAMVLGRGSISGVDTRRFSMNTGYRETERNKLGYHPGDVVFFYLGRMKVDKGLLELTLAFKRLRQEHLNAKLLLVGYDEDNLIGRIREIIDQDGAISYLGSTAKPENFLQLADVFCLPSHREGFGTSVIEASAVGIPVVCSNTYGLQGTIIEDETGLSHDVGDVDSLYEKLKQLHTNREKREQLGKGGRAFVMKYFTSEQITSEWVRFYKNLLN